MKLALLFHRQPHHSWSANTHTNIYNGTLKFIANDFEIQFHFTFVTDVVRYALLSCRYYVRHLRSNRNAVANSSCKYFHNFHFGFSLWHWARATDRQYHIFVCCFLISCLRFFSGAFSILGVLFTRKLFSLWVSLQIASFNRSKWSGHFFFSRHLHIIFLAFYSFFFSAGIYFTKA